MKRAAHLALLAALTLVTADHLQTQASSKLAETFSTAQTFPVLAQGEGLEQLAMATWPEDRTAALKILHCESRTGADPDAWRIDLPDGGPYQINRASWEKYFLVNFGWTWEEITHDAVINTAAARVIYDRTGDWSAWSCDGWSPSWAPGT